VSGLHARFSPSAAHRVVTCPASLLLCAEAPRTASWAAVEGTIAHHIHALVLAGDVASARAYLNMEPSEFMAVEDMDAQEWDLVPSGWRTDADFINAVQDSVDWLSEIKAEGELDAQYVEVRVDISNWTPAPEQFGTTDVAFVFRDGRLFVGDLKFGKGVRVSARENYQMILYALGFVAKFQWLYAFTEVTLAVSQPRLDHFDAWTVSLEDLLRYGETIRERFALALEPDAPFVPDEKACKFCPAKATCPALADLALSMFDDITDVAVMPEDRIAAVLDVSDLLTDYLNAVANYAVAKLLTGGAVNGYKLVEGRSVRQWGAEDTVVANALLGHDIHPYAPPKLLSPAAAEKLLPKDKRKLLSEYIIKPHGKPTLAHESDKRTAWEPTDASDIFDVLDLPNPDSE